MAEEKKVVTVFVLDEEGLSGVMDVMGNEEKNPMLHSLVCVAEDHPEIGNKLMLPSNPDGVFHHEEMVKAINAYKKPEKKEKEEKPKKKKSSKKNDDKEEGKYDTKVMTPKK